ncbi:MAG: WD40-repeat-containing domain protein [Linnemannia gamsii]|nr:MAG: WD40-repeat-containing domain protein [Linnemannia gamsii]
MLSNGENPRGQEGSSGSSSMQEAPTVQSVLIVARALLSNAKKHGTKLNVRLVWCDFIRVELNKVETFWENLGPGLNDVNAGLCQEVADLYTEHGDVLREIGLYGRAQESVAHAQQWRDIVQGARSVPVEEALRNLKISRLKEQDDSVYIPLWAKTSLTAPDKFLFPLMERVKNFVTSDRQVMLLLGDSGSGKSTFSQRLEQDLWEQYGGNSNNNTDSTIPLLINLSTIDRPEHDLISKHLHNAGFSEDQIKNLKQRQRQLILICTGYDEARLTTNLYAANHLNQQGQWRAKVIISCRSASLGQDYRGRFQSLSANRYNRSASNLLEEAVIAPFSKEQVKTYIGEYFRRMEASEKNKLHQDGDEPQTDSKLTENYVEQLESIPYMLDLIKNPFLLKMSLEVLPKVEDAAQDVSSSQITRALLYDKFMEHWIDAQQRRLITTLRPEQLNVFNQLHKDGLTWRVLKHLKELAVHIFKEQGGNPTIQYSNMKDQHTWKGAFFGADIKATLLRDCSPLTRSGSQYRFLHRSLLEYLASCVIYEADRPTKVPVCQQDPGHAGASVEDHPLAQRSYVDEPSVLLFLVERIQSELQSSHESPFQDYLNFLLEYSKTNTSTSGGQAASNAITVLIRAGQFFNGMDLQGIRIPGAKLIGGEFDSTDFRGAVLDGADFSRTWIRNAKFGGASMEGVLFGEWPYLQEDAGLNSCAYSLDGEHCAVGASDGSIVLYDAKTWMKIHTFGQDGRRVLSVAFSPNSKQIAAASTDGTVKLWSLNGNIVRNLKRHSDYVNCVTYSPNDKVPCLASVSDDGTILLWDVESGEPFFTLKGHGGRVLSAAFSPNGKVLATGGSDNTVRLWWVETGGAGHVLEGHTMEVTSIAFSPNGFQFASGSSDGTIQVWETSEAEDGSNLDQPTIIDNFKAGITLRGPSGQIRTIAFSPTGLQIASAFDDKILRIWDVQARVFTTVLRGHDDEVMGVAYSPDGGRIVSCSRDRTLRSWDARTSEPGSALFGKTAELLRRTKLLPDLGGSLMGRGGQARLWNALPVSLSLELGGHPRKIKCVSVTPDGASAITGGNLLRVWDLRTGEAVHTSEERGGLLHCVACSPTAMRCASGSADGTVRIWDLSTAKSISVLKGHVGTVFSIAFSPSGHQIASGGRDGTIRLWGAESGAFVLVMPNQDESAKKLSRNRPIKSLAYSLDGIWIGSGGVDGFVRLWNATTGCLQHSFKVNNTEIESIAFSPQGDQVVVGCNDATVRLFNIHTGEAGRIMEGHQDEVTSVVYLSGGTQIASGCLDGSIRLWNVDSGGMVAQFGISRSSVKCLAFCPRTQRLAVSCEDDTVRFWSVTTNTSSNSIISTAAFSPNGLQVASSTNGNAIQLWNADDGTRTHIMSGHTDFIDSFAQSPDGQQVASASRDGSARLWSTSTSETEHMLEHENGFVTSVVYSPSGEQIITGGSDGTLQIWDSRSGKRGVVFKDEAGFSTNPIFSPTGRQIAVANNDFEIRLWSTSGDPGVVLRGHTDVVTSIAYSLAGLKLVSSSADMMIRLWTVTVPNGATEPDVLELGDHVDEVICVVYSPNGRLIASGSKDATVRFWNGVDGTPSHIILAGHSGAITSIAFSPDSKLIVTGSEDKTMRLWDVEFGQPLTTVGDFVVGIKSICWRATLDAFYLVTGCNENPVRVWQMVQDGAQYDIRRHWNSESDRLAVSGADVQNVHGLSSNNLNLLIQLGAIFLSVEAPN